MSEDRRVFVGNVAFTFTRGPKSVTFTVQARMEVERQTTGTTENPLETWQATASRKIIASAGFETHHFDDASLTFPCELDMRADIEAWYRALSDLLFSEEFLQSVRKDFKRKLRAQKGSFERGQIWEERV